MPRGRRAARPSARRRAPARDEWSARRPADDLAREQIHHDGEVEPALPRPNVGDIRDPGLVSPVTVNCRCRRLGIRTAGLPTDQRLCDSRARRGVGVAHQTCTRSLNPGNSKQVRCNEAAVATQLTVGFAVVSVPVALAFLWERTTGRNMFAIFGGVPETTVVRKVASVAKEHTLFRSWQAVTGRACCR